MPQVAQELARLRAREYFTGDDDLVFPSPLGGFFGYDAMYRRYKAAQKRAGIRALRFHDLRHSFGTMAVRVFPITDVQTWMGHADIATTRKYVHYAPQPEAAARLGALVGEQLAAVSPLRTASQALSPTAMPHGAFRQAH
jgi:integrase